MMHPDSVYNFLTSLTCFFQSSSFLLVYYGLAICAKEDCTWSYNRFLQAPVYIVVGDLTVNPCIELIAVGDSVVDKSFALINVKLALCLFAPFYAVIGF